MIKGGVCRLSKGWVCVCFTINVQLGMILYIIHEQVCGCFDIISCRLQGPHDTVTAKAHTRQKGHVLLGWWYPIVWSSF